jgi:hypothetical protein
MEAVVKAHSMIMISLSKMTKCEHVEMDLHLFCNQLQPSDFPASKQLAINQPVLTGLELDIINSIV